MRNDSNDGDLKPQQEFKTQLTEPIIEGDTFLHENKLTK